MPVALLNSNVEMFYTFKYYILGFILQRWYNPILFILVLAAYLLYLLYYIPVFFIACLRYLILIRLSRKEDPEVEWWDFARPFKSLILYVVWTNPCLGSYNVLSRSHFFISEEEKRASFIALFIKLLITDFVNIIRLVGFSQTGDFVWAYYVMILSRLQGSPFSSLYLNRDPYWVNAILPDLNDRPNVWRLHDFYILTWFYFILCFYTLAFFLNILFS